MPKNEEEKNTKTPDNETTPPSTSPKKFRTPLTALVSVFGRKLEKKEYGREFAIIKKIEKLGYSREDILGAYNYYKNNKSRVFDSFAIFLWNKGQLIQDVIHLVRLAPEKEKLEVDITKDFRTMPAPKHKMTISEFLNKQIDNNNENKENLDKK